MYARKSEHAREGVMRNGKIEDKQKKKTKLKLLTNVIRAGRALYRSNATRHIVVIPRFGAFL